MFRYKEKTPGVAKIDWSLIADREDNENYLNKSMLQFYREIFNLHRDNKALRSNNLNFIHEDHENHVLVYHRW